MQGSLAQVLRLLRLAPQARIAILDLGLLLAIAGWVAKMESNRRSERTKAGLARAVAQGKQLGRPLGRKDSRKRHNRGYLLRYAK